MRTLDRTAMLLGLVALSMLIGCGTNGAVTWGPVAGVDTSAGACWADMRLAILTPHDGVEIHDNVFKQLTGMAENLPGDWSIYVFASDEFCYYLQFPAARRDKVHGTFRQRNIRLTTAGAQQFELQACAVTPEAARQLDARAARNDWSGMPNLPKGVFPLDSVTVTRVP